MISGRLIAHDIRQVLREPSLRIVLVTPLILIAVLQLAGPPILQQFPDYQQYYPLAVLLLAFQASTIVGFLCTFLFLDEKDNNLLIVYDILPTPKGQSVLNRLLFGFAYSFIASFAVFASAMSMFSFNWLVVGLTSIQFGLTGPLIMLVITSFAKNKVEGMAGFKGVDLLLLVPFLGFFFSGVWTYGLYLIPSYWAFQSFILSTTEGGTNLWIGLMGLVYQFALLFTFYFLFLKRTKA